MCLSVINEDVTSIGKGRKLGGGRSIRSILHHFSWDDAYILRKKVKTKTGDDIKKSTVRRNEGENEPPSADLLVFHQIIDIFTSCHDLLLL